MRRRRNCARLAAGAPMAQARIKELMRTSLENAYAEQLDAEAQAFGDCAVTDDFGEAVDAFFARRKPVFKGV
nr:enoyl-CoA hydratase-related protein [Mesorhizobium sediminum]